MMAQKSIQSFFCSAKTISKSSPVAGGMMAATAGNTLALSQSQQNRQQLKQHHTTNSVNRKKDTLKTEESKKSPSGKKNISDKFTLTKREPVESKTAKTRVVATEGEMEGKEEDEEEEEGTTSPICKVGKKRKSQRVIEEDSNEENSTPERTEQPEGKQSVSGETWNTASTNAAATAAVEDENSAHSVEMIDRETEKEKKEDNEDEDRSPPKKVFRSQTKGVTTKTPKSNKKAPSALKKAATKSNTEKSSKKQKTVGSSSAASISTPKTDKKESSSTEPPVDKVETPRDIASSTAEKKIVSGFNSEKKKVHEVIASSSEFSPNQESYRPVGSACWREGEQMPYLAVAKAFKLIEEEPSRLRITLTLTNLLRSAIRLSPKDVLSCVYLSLNKLGPAYEGQELGIGETLLMKALAQATGRNVDKIKEDMHSVGDLGIVAEQSRTSQKMLFVPARLTVKTVFDRLKSISEMSGNSVMSKKIEKIRSLLVACHECEARYILRTLAGKLRIGLAEQTVLTSLGQAFAAMESDRSNDKPLGELSEYKKRSEHIVYLVKSTYCEHPNMENIIKAVLQHGIDALGDHCKLTPGIPLKPMLAHPAKGVQDILSRLDSKGAFTSEYKYDGERAQIHIFDKKVKIFSRNQEDNSTKYPDVVKIAEDMVKEGVESCIIDSEIVAWDADKKAILPFQVLTTRKRKDVLEENIRVQVCIYAFDMLYLNGSSLVPKSLRERRQAMKDSLNEIEGKLAFATHSDTNDTDEIAVFLDESIKGNCEGLMIKTLDSYASYEIARRSHNWLKLKKDYLEGIGDTLDLVVIGGYRGKGKRSGVFGGFLLACYDEDSEEYQSICKIGTGFSELQLVTLNTQFADSQLDTPPTYYSYDSGLEPDAWFEPTQVWEVKAADLSLSPIHRAAMGLVEPGKGISLRFPRFIRCRDDKSPEQATGADQVAKMYNSQDQIKNANKNKTTGGNDMDDDFY